MRPPTRKDNKTGARGVVRCKNGKYRAQVKVNKHYLHLGYFDDVLDAICAASDYRIKHGLNDHYRRSPDGHNDQAA
jgi:transcription elongation factor Elf1